MKFTRRQELKETHLDDIEDITNTMVDANGLFDDEIKSVSTIEDESLYEEVINEANFIDTESGPELPVTLLSRDEVIARAQEMKKGVQMLAGYIRNVPVAAKFKNGKPDKITGEVPPIVRIVKCIEYEGRTGINYGNTAAIKARNADPAWIERQASMETNAAAERAGIAEWVVHYVIGKNKAGNEVLMYFPHTGNTPRAQYYISKDGAPYEKCGKNDIVPYLTPADANKILNPEPFQKTVPTSQTDENGNVIERKNIIVNTLYSNQLYAFKNLGGTNMVVHRKPKAAPAEENPVEENPADVTVDTAPTSEVTQ